MSRVSRAALLTIGGLVVIIGSAVGIVSFIGRSMCGNEVLSETPSPDGKWKAVIFIVDCGATTTDRETAPRVSILRAGDSLSNSDSGNVFGVSPAGAINHPSVQADWEGPSQLVISYPARAAVFKQAERYKDVTIKYRAELRGR